MAPDGPASDRSALTEAAGLYERDFFAWTQAQAALLRGGQAGRLDVAHLAEEIEALGGSERSELKSRLRVLLVHLLKWHYQPQRRGASWRLTILEQRDDLADVLSRSPSLRRHPGEILPAVYVQARRRAAAETNLDEESFPETCPFTIEQIFDPGFWPEAAAC